MTVTAVATPDQSTRIPFQPATFGDVLRSEWTKLRSVAADHGTSPDLINEIPHP